MKDNVVDFEARYYLNKQKEAKEKLLNKDFKGAISVLKTPCEKIDKLLETEVYCPQNIFESAICLNFLGKEVHQTNFSKINFYDFYLMMGAAYYNLDDKEHAREYYDKAIKLDPCSAFARVFEMKISIEMNDFEEFLTKVQDALFFSYFRSDMAKVYNFAGDYLVYKKDYEMAIVSYNLSNVYELNDDVATKIKETSSKAEIDLDSKNFLAEDYMKKFYNTYKIALMPNQNMIKLSLAMAKDSLDKKDYWTSKFCYEIAYDLTLDESIKPIIKDLEEKCKK